MFCVKCGHQVEDGAAFCGNCGAKIAAPEKVQPQLSPRGNGSQTASMQPPQNGKPDKSGSGLVIAAVSVAGAAVLGAGAFFLWDSVLKDRGAGEQVSKDLDDEEKEEEREETEETSPAETTAPSETTASAETEVGEVESMGRPAFLPTGAQLSYQAELVPSVESYTVDSGLANVSNADQFYLDEKEIAALEENGFFVMADSGSSEFFEIYEDNRYAQLPSFVTVDSLMHTYHIYFSYLLKNAERDYLADTLASLSADMFTESGTQYETLKGTEWERAALRNVAFFAIACRLQDVDVTVPSEIEDLVDQEINKITEASQLAECSLFEELWEDYSQYKPRGYYEGDERLEQYFRAMMWYGRMSFQAEDEDASRSALLMTLAQNEESCLDAWNTIYTITSFFAGASDDLGYYELFPVIQACYGEDADVQGLAGNDAAWTSYLGLVEELTPPQINSVPIEDGQDNTILCYRFMGQRFSVDASIMQKLIYQEVGENSSGETRMLPDVLDVMAVLGSDVALELLEQQGDTDYAGFTDNLNRLRDGYLSAPETLWSASLYAQWINTLRPLLTPKESGYPSFMQTRAWALKNLQTFAGSYTELKHDTVLYSKQVIAEMGGGDEEILDDRGYVEPEPLVYARFAYLAENTASGLSGYGMISDADAENLRLLAELAGQLAVISEKELQNETLTDEEYELIRSYGGNLEHFWLDAMRGMTGQEYISVAEYPCSLVTDIATNPDAGSVLEIATGKANPIYAVVPVDGDLRLARGSVYSFYQFEWQDGRLTDTQWRQMMGFEADDNYEYRQTAQIEQPWWTDEYQVSWQD